MAYILSIETATTNCSVSLSYQGETLFLKEDYNDGYSHAERLHIYIDDILTKSKITKERLDAIAVSKGPGSYTGLRIGVSSAKGLCYALNIPLISIPTLTSLAHQVNTDGQFIVPLLDARRMEVYSSIFNQDFNEVRDTKAEIIDQHSFTEYLNSGKVHFIGNGTAKTKEVIDHENAVFIDDKLPSANEMSQIAYNKYKISDMENVAYFEPFYLKDFIALKKS